MKFSEMPYERIDAQKVVDKYDELIKRQLAAASGEEQLEIHDEYYELSTEVMTLQVLAMIRHSVDTSDAFYSDELDYWNATTPQLRAKDNEYHKVLMESKFRPVLESRLGKVAFKSMEYASQAMCDELIPLMQEENALATQYENLISRAKIMFRGQEYNTSLITVHTTSADRETRREAWKALDDYFASVTDEIDDIYDKLVANRTAQAKLLGMDNYVKLGYYRMNRTSYGPDEVKAVRDGVKKYIVPLCVTLGKRRAARLGIAPEDMHLYDEGVFFAEGNPAPENNPAAILAKGQDMYSQISDTTKEFFDFMMENELFDVLGRKNKQTGGYMEYLPKYKSPFIFANFNGTRGDVDVITHECGHAFQGYVQRDEKVREFADITMDVAEIHSMSMEYFTYGWMDMFFGDRMGEYLRMHLEDSILFLPYGCMVDEFQQIIYEHPELTKAERKETWKRLESEYRPQIDFSGTPFMENGGYWQRQHHIFSFPFYYIDYVLASMCAMQFKIRMDDDFDGAFDDYMKLCRLGAKMFYPDLLHECGLKVPYEDGMVESLAKAMGEKAL